MMILPYELLSVHLFLIFNLLFYFFKDVFGTEINTLKMSHKKKTIKMVEKCAMWFFRPFLIVFFPGVFESCMFHSAIHFHENLQLLLTGEQ